MWYAIAFLGGIALGLGLRVAFNYFSLIRVVGVHSPVAIMEVGGTDKIKARLFYKSRFSTAQVVPVNGTITYWQDGAITNHVYNLSNGQTSNAFAAQPTVTETLTGTQIGNEVMGVRGTDTAGNAYDRMGVNVRVVANQPDSVTFYRVAIRISIEWWETGLLGNLRININSSPPAGLCDQWMDWAADWLQYINKGDICRIEKCLSADGTHNYLRITLRGGAVIYLDPWRRPSDPVFDKDEFEDDYGLPVNVHVYYEIDCGSDTSIGALRTWEAEEEQHRRALEEILGSGDTSSGTLRTWEAEMERHRRRLREILGGD